MARNEGQGQANRFYSDEQIIVQMKNGLKNSEKRRRIVKVCEYCKKEFETFHKSQKFCSPKTKDVGFIKYGKSCFELWKKQQQQK